MRAAIFADTFPPDINGVATATYNLFKTLNDNGVETIVVVPNHFGTGFQRDGNIVRIPGLEVKALYGYRASFLWDSEAFKAVRDFKPDVIHMQTDAGIGQFGYIAAARLKVPGVYTYHTCLEDYTHYVTKGAIDRFAKGVARTYTRVQSLRSYEFIAPSQKIKDYLRSIGVDDHISVLPTGIEFGKFARSNEDKAVTAQLKAKYGIKEDDFVLLSLGRIAKEKSTDVCIRGFARYVEEYPNAKVKFLVVGFGPALEELKALASSLNLGDKCVFTGAVDPSETQKYYWLGDAFISASLTETQGLTFMEAMASRLVVMARYDDNLLGTIRNGKTGFFYEGEEDMPEVLEKVIGLSKDDRSVVEEASLKAIEPYSMKVFFENVKGVYERAIKKYW